MLATTAACARADDARPAARADAAPRSSALALVDDGGRTVRLRAPARRVVSLVPNVTETLFAVGAGSALAGRTDYDRGAAVAAVPSVGGGLDPNLERLAALRPDLVIGWSASSAGRDLGAQLAALGIPFFAIRTEDTTDVLRTVRNVGALTGRRRAADSVAAALSAQWAAVRASVAGRPRPRVFYAVSTAPPMTAGPRTFLIQIIQTAGGETVFPDVRANWPTLSLEEVVRRQPDAVILPVGATDDVAARVAALRRAPGWSALRAVREGRVVTVPGELMERAGPSLGEAARRMRDALDRVRSAAPPR